MTADDRLILIRVKIERAKKHLADLERELIEFGDRKFHAVTTDPKTKGRELGEHRILQFDFLAAAGDVVTISEVPSITLHVSLSGSAPARSRVVESSFRLRRTPLLTKRKRLEK